MYRISASTSQQLGKNLLSPFPRKRHSNPQMKFGIRNEETAVGTRSIRFERARGSPPPLGTVSLFSLYLHSSSSVFCFPNFSLPSSSYVEKSLTGLIDSGGVFPFRFPLPTKGYDLGYLTNFFSTEKPYLVAHFPQKTESKVS